MKALFVFAFVFVLLNAHTQTKYIVQPTSINRLLNLLQQQDSIKLFLKESPVKVINGDSCYQSLLPAMSSYPIQIQKKTQNKNSYTFLIHIASPRETTFPRLRAELRLLMRAKVLLYEMQPIVDNEYEMICNGDKNTQIRLLYNEKDKIAHLYVRFQ